MKCLLQQESYSSRWRSSNSHEKVMDDEVYAKVVGAFLEPLKDYRAAVTDTFLQTAKKFIKRIFDKFADSALKNGYAFRSVEEARLAGIPTNNLRTNYF